MKLSIGVHVALAACGSNHDVPSPSAAKTDLPAVVGPRDATIAVDTDTSPCGPLRIVMDDDRSIIPITLIARTHNGGDVEVVISNDKLTCTEIAMNERAVGATEITVNVNLGFGTSPMSQDFVAFDGDQQDAMLQLQGAKPHADGDVVVVCIAPIILRGLSQYMHHHLQISGTARSIYCP